jgi:hypothetical protein
LVGLKIKKLGAGGFVRSSFLPCLPFLFTKQKLKFLWNWKKKYFWNW